MSVAPRERIVLEVLGPIRATRAGEPVALSGRIPLRLVACLTARGGPASNDVLTDAVWGDAPPASSASALRVHLSRLRKLLGPDSLVTGPQGYELGRTVELDLDCYRHLVTAARAERQGDPTKALRLLTEARELWRGVPWPEVDDCAAVTDRRQLLVAEHLRTEDDWASLVVDLGRGPDHVTELSHLARAEPLREERWALMITALHQAGRDAEALRAYDEAREVLADQLGAVPGPMLQRAYDRALAGPAISPTPTLAARHHVPMVGRGEELARVGEALQRSRLVTVTGIGGIGKSRLAEHLSQAARRRGETVRWLDASATGADLALGRSLARQLGFHPPTEEDARDLITHHLTGVDILVLDGVAPGSQAVVGLLAWLLDTRPRLRILATSRTPIGLSGEAVRPLGPLPLPAVGSHDVAGTAVEMMAHIRGADVADPAVLAALAAECRATSGVPLLIELAAHRSQARPATEVSGSIAATVREALGGLDGPWRRVTAGIAVLPSGLTDGAAHILSAPESPGRWLSYLTWSGLVDTRRSGTTVSYQMLDPVRDAVRAELTEEETSRVWDALAEHLTALGQALRPSLDEAPRYDVFRLIDAEGINVGELLGRARTDRLDVLEALAAHLGCRGRAGDGQRWVEADLAGDDPARAATAALVGARIGRFSDSLVPLTGALLDAVEHFATEGDTVRGASAGLYATLATCYGSDPVSAARVLQRIDPLLAEATDWLRAMIDVGHGFVRLLEWDLGSALDRLLAAEVIFARDDEGGLAMAHYLRGIFSLLRETETQPELLAAARIGAENVGDLPLVGLCRFAEIGTRPRGEDRVHVARSAADALDVGGLPDWAAQARLAAAKDLIEMGSPSAATLDLLAAMGPLTRSRPSAVRLALSGLALSLQHTAPTLAREVAAAARARPVAAGEATDHRWLESFDPSEQHARPLDQLLIRIVEHLEGVDPRSEPG